VEGSVHGQNLPAETEENDKKHQDNQPLYREENETIYTRGSSPMG
jgi:hypothetical protein